MRAWAARNVAEQTRPLSWEACAELDAQLSGLLGTMTWGRFQRILTAAILDADPTLAEERAERARRLRDVWASDSEDGLKTIIARAVSRYVWFLATIDRIADLLAVDCDTDPVGVRRSKAVGILARPAQALALLAAHRDGPTDQTEPADAEIGDPDQDEAPAAPEHDDHVSQPTGLPGGRDLTAVDLRAARPKVVLPFHLSDVAVQAGHGMVRPEHGEPVMLAELREWLTGTGCRVSVQPVFDPADVAPVDAYEIPQRTRDAVRLRTVADVFPYGSCTTATMDLDHTVPYLPMDHGGPPGQTAVDNLGPMTRRHHRTVTHGRWGKRQPAAGQYVFRSPKGYVYLVTDHGTLPLGNTEFSRALWTAAAPK